MAIGKCQNVIHHGFIVVKYYLSLMLLKTQYSGTNISLPWQCRVTMSWLLAIYGRRIIVFQDEWIKDKMLQYHQARNKTGDDVIKSKRFTPSLAHYEGHRSTMDFTSKSSDADVSYFLVVSLNELFNKEPSCLWLEIPRRSCDITVIQLNQSLYDVQYSINCLWIYLFVYSFRY